MVSETETEEEVLFESKKNAKPEKQGLLQNNTIKNNLSDPGKPKNTNNPTWLSHDCHMIVMQRFEYMNHLISFCIRTFLFEIVINIM